MEQQQAAFRYTLTDYLTTKGEYCEEPHIRMISEKKKPLSYRVQLGL